MTCMSTDEVPASCDRWKAMGLSPVGDLTGRGCGGCSE